MTLVGRSKGGEVTSLLPAQLAAWDDLARVGLEILRGDSLHSLSNRLSKNHAAGRILAPRGERWLIRRMGSRGCEQGECLGAPLCAGAHRSTISVGPCSSTTAVMAWS
eukprot:scaffold31478_cov101-Isochrysis_galbana.AAC.7